MCLRQKYIWVERGPSYEQIPASCGECWRCRSNYVSDYVGRGLAEASTSDWTCVLTLTYRNPTEQTKDKMAHKVITQTHHSEFIRSLRDWHRQEKKRNGSNRSHSIRFLTAGEYGDLKGRAHFHTILFGNGTPPEIPYKQNANIPWWPYGHVFADWDADEKALRYATKYLLKNQGEYYKAQSKYPPLGNAFFMEKAQHSIDMQVFPSSFNYLPPNGSRGRPYMMTGATKRNYLAAIMAGLPARNEKTLNPWVFEAKEKVSLWELRQAAKYGKLHDWLQAFKCELDKRRPTQKQINHILAEPNEKWLQVKHNHVMDNIRDAGGPWSTQGPDLHGEERLKKS